MINVTDPSGFLNPGNGDVAVVGQPTPDGANVLLGHGN